MFLTVRAKRQKCDSVFELVWAKRNAYRHLKIENKKSIKIFIYICIHKNNTKCK